MKKIYKEFIRQQREASYSSDLELIPEDDFENANSYKISYRTCDVLTSKDNYGFLNDFLNGKLMSDTEVIAFLKNAHPYFQFLFKNKEEINHFLTLYNYFIEINEG